MKVQLRPEMMEDLLEPSLTREFIGSNVFLMIDVILLDLYTVVTEMTEMRPCDVVLRENVSSSKLTS